MTADATIRLGSVLLTCGDLLDIAHRRAKLALSEDGREAITRARLIVDRLVEAEIPAYGITTGVGSQKDFSLSREAIARYNDLMITAHATVSPGRPAPKAVIRAALGIQLALFARGRSGVRLELVESLLARLEADDLPNAQLDSSLGASDIVAMSQLAVPLIGKAGVGPGGTGPRPLAGLAAKEAISLLNSNSLMLAEGVLVLAELRALIDAATVTGALSMEGFRGQLQSWGALVDAGRGQAGQSRTGAALRAALEGSRLWQPGEARFLQDPLSFRCIPQIHGAAEAAYDFAHGIYETELSAACDNPMIDLASGHFISHGNMETTACALAMDTLRQSVAKMIETAGQRIHKIQWPSFTGLPSSLAAEPGAIGGVQFLNFGHLAAANVGAVRQAAQPALLNYSGQVGDGVEDVAGNAPQSIAETVRMLPHAWTVVTIEAACAVWAIHRRGLPEDSLGAGVRPILAALLPLLPIGREGIALFDLRPVVAALQAQFGADRSLFA